MKIYRRLLQIMLLCSTQLVPAGVISAWEQQSLETVSQVDLNRYVGTWYEIARLPNWFQDQCAGNVTAEYQRLDDGNIAVVNRCLDEKGKIDEARGVARVVDKTTNAKLEVSFVSLFGWHLFWGDYWILDLGDDYAHVVVGTPSRKYAWILARSISLPAEAWERTQQILLKAGYDPEKLEKTRQTDLPRQ
jgi:apolipoprotein D and lipocalin family protein